MFSSQKTRWLVIILVAVFGHFLDGWVNPLHETILGWWLWHAVNWLRRDLVLVILLWPLIMEKEERLFFGRCSWSHRLAYRYDFPERLAWWTVAAVSNYLLHQILYTLGLLTRNILQ